MKDVGEDKLKRCDLRMAGLYRVQGAKPWLTFRLTFASLLWSLTCNLYLEDFFDRLSFVLVVITLLLHP
jgi:hypothetical protein